MVRALAGSAFVFFVVFPILIVAFFAFDADAHAVMVQADASYAKIIILGVNWACEFFSYALVITSTTRLAHFMRYAPAAPLDLGEPIRPSL